MPTSQIVDLTEKLLATPLIQVMAVGGLFIMILLIYVLVLLVRYRQNGTPDAKFYQETITQLVSGVGEFSTSIQDNTLAINSVTQNYKTDHAQSQLTAELVKQNTVRVDALNEHVDKLGSYVTRQMALSSGREQQFLQLVTTIQQGQGEILSAQLENNSLMKQLVLLMTPPPPPGTEPSNVIPPPAGKIIHADTVRPDDLLAVSGL